MREWGAKGWVEEVPYWTALTVSAVLVVIMLLPILFPGREPSYPFDNRPQYGGVLRIDVPGPLGTLNPYSGASGYALYAMQMMFNSLCRRNRAGEMEPELAESWEVRSDAPVWTFHLRPNVLFHNGRILTARDVRVSIETYVQKNHPRLWRRITGIRVINSNTLSIRLQCKTPFVLEYLADIPIVPVGAAKEQYDWLVHPVGTGPFRFLRREGRDKLVLEAFPDYFEGRPYLDRVELTYQKRWRDIWWRMFAEEADAVLDAEPVNFKYFKLLPYLLQTAAENIPYGYVIVFNVRRPPLNDVRVRQAIAYGIDLSRLSENPVERKGRSGYDGKQPSFRPASLFPFSVEYNPRKARSLLREAGWEDRDGDGYADKNGERLVLRLIMPSWFTWEQEMVQRIMLQLYRLGIRLEWVRLDKHESLLRVLKEGRFDAVFSSICLRPERPDFLYNDFHSKGIWNYGGYSNPRTDRLLEKILEETDRSRQIEIYAQITRRIVNDHPVVFLGWKHLVSALSNYFGGFEHILTTGVTRRDYRGIYLRTGARPGSFQLLNYQRSAPRGFWADKWTPLDVLLRTH